MKILSLCLCLMISLLIVSFTAVGKEKPVLNIQHWIMKNGAKVYFVRAPEIPMIDIDVVFAAGSAHDGKYWGIASFVNAMLNEGTSTKTANQIAEALDNVGAQVSGAVDRDMAVVSLRTLVEPKYLNPALAIFTEMIAKSSFPTVAFNRVKRLTLASIQQSQQSPSSVALKSFYRTIYGNFPYGHPTSGTLQSVSALTAEQVKAFYARYYVASNADIVLVGDVTRTQAMNIASKIMNALAKGKPAKRLKLAKENTKGADHYIPFPAKQNTIILGQLAISFKNPNYFPLLLGNHILGGSGLVSIFFEEVRNKRGLAYDVSSRFVPLMYRGPFLITLQTRVNKAKQAISIVRKVLQKFIRVGPTQKELRATKLNLIGSFPLKLSTNKNIMANVARIAFYQRPLNYLDTYRARVQAVTKAQIKNAFQQQVHLNDMSLIIVGSKT